MTTDPTADRPTSTPASEPAVLESAAPYGIAPFAAAGTTPRRRSRRRRVVDAAVVTSALATLPVAAAWNRAEVTADGPTLVEAVAELDAAEDETAFRASAAALEATAQRRSTTATVTPTVAGPPAVTPAVTTPDALMREAQPGAAATPDAPRQTPPTATTEEDAPETLEAAADAATAPAPTPIARVAGIELVAPSKDTVLVGFHEAAAPGTLEMESLAPLAVALNGERTGVAPDASGDQVAPVMELPTRDRAAGPASAVDIAVPAWRDIVAPVSGTVTAVHPYTLYGEFADNRVEIEPEDQPGVRVVMIHIGEIEVRPGDEVVAGETLVARTAKQFPFSSQIDRFAEHASGEARPHVHMEVMRVG
ncbi:MAG: M23 family metallopeptidase [Actinobacteria bacterium]|nr:M23 family metallopeptidase [Actinomycetota bacterium]